MRCFITIMINIFKLIFEDTFKTIILPIICSLIGGGLTLLGVVITIKHENKINRSNNNLNNKPLFYSKNVINKNKRLSLDTDISCSFYDSNHESKMIGLYGVIKNTDKALLIMKKINVNSKEYYPDNTIFEKDKLISINLYVDQKLKKSDKIKLIISDINGNEYTYKILFTLYEEEYKSDPAYIMDFKEI